MVIYSGVSIHYGSRTSRVGKLKRILCVVWNYLYPVARPDGYRAMTENCSSFYHHHHHHHHNHKWLAIAAWPEDTQLTVIWHMSA